MGRDLVEGAVRRLDKNHSELSLYAPTRTSPEIKMQPISVLKLSCRFTKFLSKPKRAEQIVVFFKHCLQAAQISWSVAVLTRTFFSEEIFLELFRGFTAEDSLDNTPKREALMNQQK